MRLQWVAEAVYEVKQTGLDKSFYKRREESTNVPSKPEYEALGIKTPEGQRIYRQGLARAGVLQDRVAEAKSRSEKRELDLERQRVLAAAIEQGRAANPKPRAKKPIKRPVRK